MSENKPFFRIEEKDKFFPYLKIMAGDKEITYTELVHAANVMRDKLAGFGIRVDFTKKDKQ
jgi:hypothetical protein